MGLFDAIKSMKNAVTGGSAKVYVDIPSAKLTEPFQIKVRAVSQGSDVKYSRVYLHLEGIEAVEIPDHEIQVQENGASRTRRENIKKAVTTLKLELTVTGAGELKADQTGEWTVEAQLPAGAVPEFRGKLASHTYRASAGLDCFGNDPDSGWVGFRVA